MDFNSIFDAFEEKKNQLKVISIATATKNAKPNAASKMLIDIKAPNTVYFLDYKFTQSYNNILTNPQVSVSFMDDVNFTGYRLTGPACVLESGPEFDEASRSWDKRLIAYETDRMIERIRGRHSTREAERHLPKDFVIVKLEANEGSAIKPDRIFRAEHD